MKEIFTIHKNLLSEVESLASEYIDDVFDYYNSFLEEGKPYPDILYNLIILYLWLDKKEKISSYLSKLLQKNNHYSKYLNLKKYIKNQSSKFQLPSKINKKIKKEIPRKVYEFYLENKEKFDERPFFIKEFYNILGDYARFSNRCEDAFDFYLFSFLYSKNISELYKNIGTCYNSENDLERAYKYLKKSIKKNKGQDSDTLLEFSHICAELNKEKEALSSLLTIHKNNPHYPDVSYRIGKYYLDKSEIEKAKLFFEKALDINPNYSAANIDYFYILLKENNKKEIIEFFKRLPESRDKDIFEFFYTLQFSKNFDKSFDIFKKYDDFMEQIFIGFWNHIINSIDEKNKIKFLNYIEDNNLLSIDKLNQFKEVLLKL